MRPPGVAGEGPYLHPRHNFWTFTRNCDQVWDPSNNSALCYCVAVATLNTSDHKRPTSLHYAEILVSLPRRHRPTNPGDTHGKTTMLVTRNCATKGWQDSLDLCIGRVYLLNGAGSALKAAASCAVGGWGSLCAVVGHRPSRGGFLPALYWGIPVPRVLPGEKGATEQCCVGC